MEKLSMCRICLSDDIPLRTIVRTPLQEVYESLTTMPFVAEGRPVVVCNLCCARLENSSKDFLLKEKCLQSEKLFAELVQGNVVSGPSSDSVDVVKTEYFIKIEPVFEQDPLESDGYVHSTESKDNISFALVKEELSDVPGNDATVEPSSSSEWDVPLSVVKEEPAALGTVFEMSSKNAEKCKNYRKRKKDVTLKIKKTPLTSAERSRMYRLRQKQLTHGIKSSANEVLYTPSTSNSRMTFEPSPQPVTTDNAAVEQDDADPSHNTQGIHTECDIPLDIVKEEPDDVDSGAPRLAAQKYRNDTLLNSLKRTDQTLDKVEERNREIRRDIEDTPVEKNKIVETGDKKDIKLHHDDKQNNSTSDHSDVRKEMCENKISADQSVNSSSSDKLTPWSCETCQKCFSCRANLRRHVSTHTGTKPYQCNLCKKCFSQKSHLDMHIRTHTGEKPYECNVCKKCFSDKGNLDKHVRTHTGEKPYQCSVCKKCFNKKNHLDDHILTHTGEKPYECAVCKKCYVNKGHLNVHMRTHTGLKPYECNVCKKCFSHKSSLDTHLRTHTGEKPYECNVCKKCFNQRGDLREHVRTHTGEKPYQCNVCKKCFKKKNQLNCHILTHTGEKPYECTVCKKCFTNKSQLNVHMRRHTGEKPYKCYVCKKSFYQKSHLDSHKKCRAP